MAQRKSVRLFVKPPGSIVMAGGLNWRMTLVFLACLAMLLPDIAEARAGGGRSMGSRGGRTYSAPTYRAQPLQRSIEPRQAMPNYQSRPQPAFTPQPQMQMGYMPQSSGWSPFWRGMAGGFLGMSIANMLLGHSGYGYGAGYVPGMAVPGTGVPGEALQPHGSNMGRSVGGLLQLLLFGGLIWFGWRLLRRNMGYSGYAASPLANLFRLPSQTADMVAPIGSRALGHGSGTAHGEMALAITAADQDAIGALLPRIQAAWNDGDMDRLRSLTTVEMQKYFSDAMAANSSRGLANKVEQVRLLQAEILESWAEYDMEYATARLRWRALDYMVRLDNRRVVEGNAATPEEIEEVWTVTRTRGGGWVLSAIQQAA